MKVTFKKEEILQTITRSLGFVTSEKTNSSSEGILISTIGQESCQIVAYDFQKGIKTNINAEVYEEGAMVVNGQKFSSIIRVMPGDVTIETTENNGATITSGKTKFQINCYPSAEYQQMPVIKTDKEFELTQKQFKSIINQTIFGIAQEDNRTQLTGLYVEVSKDEVVAVSCNGFCLCLRKEQIETNMKNEEDSEKISFIIPLKVLNELLKLLDDSNEKIYFKLTRKNIIMMFDFEVGKEKKTNIIQSRLIDQAYIEYERLIPKESKTFVNINKSNLEDALIRSSLVTEEKISGQAKSMAKFSFRDQNLHISTVSNNGKVYDDISVEKEGNDLDIAFDCKYLLRILKGADENYLKLSLTSSLMSMIIEGTSEESKFLYLALPTKMRNE